VGAVVLGNGGTRKAEKKVVGGLLGGGSNIASSGEEGIVGSIGREASVKKISKGLV
jgi:hypothetical protein